MQFQAPICVMILWIRECKWLIHHLSFIIIIDFYLYTSSHELVVNDSEMEIFVVSVIWIPPIPMQLPIDLKMDSSPRKKSNGITWECVHLVKWIHLPRKMLGFVLSIWTRSYASVQAIWKYVDIVICNPIIPTPSQIVQRMQETVFVLRIDPVFSWTTLREYMWGFLCNVNYMCLLETMEMGLSACKATKLLAIFFNSAFPFPFHSMLNSGKECILHTNILFNLANRIFLESFNDLL